MALKDSPYARKLAKRLIENMIQVWDDLVEVESMLHRADLTVDMIEEICASVDGEVTKASIDALLDVFSKSTEETE
jgi:hypothetical protein